MNCLRVGTGPTLVLVHGFLSGLTYWEKQFELFSTRFDVVAFDLPGYGGKAHEVGLDSVEGFADFVLAKLDALGIDCFHLIGHSMGGMIAQEVAIKAADRVAGLVLYATGPMGRCRDVSSPSGKVFAARKLKGRRRSRATRSKPGFQTVMKTRIISKGWSWRTGYLPKPTLTA